MKLLLALVPLFMSVSAVADPASTTPGSGRSSPADSSSSTTIGWPYPACVFVDQHGLTRAVAYASLILQKGGADPKQWKDFNANNYCAIATIPASGTFPSTSPSPIPPSAPTRPSDPGVPPLPRDPLPLPPPTPVDPITCWSASFTTNYALAECPDGRAALLRSGVGVTFKDRENGDTFSWTEVMDCNSGIPIPGASRFASDLLNRSRPLDYQHMQISPL